MSHRARERIIPAPRASLGHVMLVAALTAATTAAVIALLQAPGPARGQTAPPRTSAEVIPVAARLTPETYGMFLIDTNHGSLAVYEFSQNQLHLKAVRTYIYDTQLDALNTSEPRPQDVADMLRRARPIEQPDVGAP